MSREGVRLKWVRNLIDDWHSLRKGWLFKMVKPAAPNAVVKKWPTIADFPTKIKWRPELGDQNENRIHNIALCASFINGVVLQPGEVFCLRKVIGDPISSRGFKSGPMLIRGALDEAAGGGVCQVSTALYNAALLANLEILQQFNHSTDIWGENRFIDLGRDAVFVYALKDLKFRNNHDAPIQFKMNVSKQDLILNCMILSSTALKGTVEIETSILQKIMPGDTNDIVTIHTPVNAGWKVKIERKLILANGSSNLTYSKINLYKPCKATS